MADPTGPATTHESERLAVLEQYDFDAIGCEAFDEVTQFAAALCGTPIALVSIVEEKRQRFLARAGTELRETPRETSFCAHTMLGDAMMVVPDARTDSRFAANALVVGDPFIRFYAGMPLISREGLPMGALCVVDTVPRPGLTPLQAQGLAVLAHQLIERLDATRRDIGSARALSDSEQRFRVLADTMPQMVWSARPDGHHDYFNARWYEFTGTEPGANDGDAWADTIHPEDRERAWAAWRRSIVTGDPYEIEYRLRHHGGDYRWTLGRALPIRDGSGAITRWFGTCTDIHERKMAFQEREMIAHELSHRIKNIFSVIGGLIGFSAREHPETTEHAQALRDRVMALGRAHDYVRPHSAQSASELGHNSLTGVLRELFAPYDDEEGARIRIEGEDMEVDDRSATPLALLFHELATNAAKYGALSSERGHVLVALRHDANDCAIDWREEGGPAVMSPTRIGFGAKLMELSVERQLGGRIERNWRPEGLEVSVIIPRRTMNRTEGKA